MLIDVIDEVKIKSFYYNSKILIDGEKAKIHFGVGGKNRMVLFRKNGLDLQEYALFDYSQSDDGVERVMV
jgi:hypothetical protein